MNIRKKRVIEAMTDDEFYTRDVPSVPAGKVVVKPHRGNWTVFIGLPDGTVAYQWCESKAAAQREAEYAKHHIKKNGNQDDFWIGQGYNIWNPNVESKKKVACKAAPKRKSVVKAGKMMPYTLWVLDGDDNTWKMYKGMNAPMEEMDIDYDDFLDQLNVKAFPNGTYYNNYVDFVVLPAGEKPTGKVKASTSTKRKRTIKAATSSGVLIKTECREGTYYLTKSSTKQKTFWSVDISKANVFAKKESALNKLYAVLRKLPENAFYDEDAIFDFEDISDMKSAEFAEFFITDTSGNDIEDISEEVKKSLLSDEQFISSVFDDDFDDDIEESTSIKRKRTIKADALSDFRKDWTERIFDKNYPDETITVYFKDGRNPAQYPATALDGMMQESIVDYIIDSNTGELLYESEHGDVRGSTSTNRKFIVKASALDDARDNREELSGTYYIVYNGDIIVETDGTGDAGAEALAEVFAMDNDALDAAAKYLNSFGDDLVYNRHEVDENGHEMSWIEDGGEWDPDDVARTLAQFIQMEYDEGKMDPTYFGSEIYWDGGRIEWFDAADLAESNNVDEWIENTDLSAEDIGIDSAQAVECAMRPVVEKYITQEFMNGIPDTEPQKDFLSRHSDDFVIISMDDKYIRFVVEGPARDSVYDALESVAETYYAEYPIIHDWRDMRKYGMTDVPRYVPIDSAQAVECAYDPTDENAKYDATFTVESYYDDRFYGLEDSMYTDDWSEVEEWAHDHLMRGGNIRIDSKYGILEVTADEYNDVWENYDVAGFDINDEIAEYKQRIVNGSQSVKCSESIMAYVGDEVDTGEIKDALRAAGVREWGVEKSRHHGKNGFEDSYRICVDDVTGDFEAVVNALEAAGFSAKFLELYGNWLEFSISDTREEPKYCYRVSYDYTSDIVPMDDATTDYGSIIDALIDQMESEGNTGYLYTLDEVEDEGWNEDEYVIGGNHGLALYHGGNLHIEDLGMMKPSEAVNSSTSIQAEHTTLRDRDITSADDVRELVLYITNDGDLYRQRTTPIIENLKRKVKKGNYDRELAVKAWQYLADDGVRKYDKEFGSGRGSLTLLDKATREEIARELRDYYEEEVMWDVNHPESSDDLTTV